MPDPFEYISRSRLEFKDGYRRAYLGDVPEPVVYGVQGALREYYGALPGPPIASTLDHIVADQGSHRFPESPSSNPQREALVAMAELLAKILDSTIKIPGTPFYVGLDPLLGLIPGLGDILVNLIGTLQGSASVVLSQYLADCAGRSGHHRVPWRFFAPARR